MANMVANTDWLIVTVLYRLRHAFSGILNNYKGVTPYIRRRFIPSTAFLVPFLLLCIFSIFYIYIHAHKRICGHFPVVWVSRLSPNVCKGIGSTLGIVKRVFFSRLHALL